MKQLLFVIICTLFLLPQCAYINREKSFAPIRHETNERTGTTANWRQTHQPHIVSQKINDGLSLHEAIALGIDNNPRIQALFEDIGIKKADLIQAGFYSNPRVETVFFKPKNDENKTAIDFGINWKLSDLWQVPLRKKVAQDDVESKTYEIISEILFLRKEIQQRYVDCLYHQRSLETVKEILHIVKSLKKRIDYRYQFGFGTKLEKYVAESRLAEWNAKVVDAHAMLRNAYLSLRAILGGIITDQEIELEMLSVDPLAASQNELTNYALSSHPLIIAEQAKIARAKHSISFETSRIFDNVHIGFSYERDFEKGVSGLGPSFGLSLPFFDTNYGNIERAKYEKKQAEKTVFVQKEMLSREIATRYINYQSYYKQMKQYEKHVLPPAMKGISFSKEYFDKMQIDLLVFLETQIDLFQHSITFLELQRAALREYSELEFAVGAQIQA